MKKLLLIFALLLLCAGGHAQKSKKKKSKSKAATTAIAGPKSLAKADNLSVDYAKGELYLSIAGAAKDTVSLRRNGLGEPSEVAVKPVTCSGNKLYCVTWTEKKKTGDPKSKLEDITQKHTVIVDVASKAKVLANMESANRITEKVYLTADKYVSETQEKVRREGMECSVAADGSVVLKNKSTQTKLVYNPAEKKFIAKK